MAALVQAFPSQQPSAPSSLLQPRPQSASGILQTTQHQSHAHTMQQHRAIGSYGPAPTNNNTTMGGYRSYSGNAPVAPYAFTSTPGLTSLQAKPIQQTWPDNKNLATRQLGPEEIRMRYPVSDTSSSSSSISSEPPLRYQNQKAAVSTRPASIIRANPPRPVSVASLPTQPSIPPANAARPSPDRYRRGNKKGDSTASLGSPTVQTNGGPGTATGSGMAAASPSVAPGATNNQITTSANASGAFNPIATYSGQLRSQSVDDIHAHVRPNTLNQQQRRSSVGAFTADSLTMLAGANGQATDPRNLQLPSFAPSGANQRLHTPTGSSQNVFPRRGSNDSSVSVNSSSSHSNRPNSSPNHNNNNASSTSPSAMNLSTTHEINLAHVPPRDSSQVAKRMTAPSPLSKPVNMNSEAESAIPRSRNGTADGVPSAAAERLAALSADPSKGLKNRLRRAFSFGSAAELRKAAVGNSGDAAERVRLRQERYREEQNLEQNRIAQQQEASGLGEGIYNGQGHFFTGSTDNLSVSSTASSASIMIRKMGKGMKKSTRSLVGLFRPRSVIGVPAASGPVATEPSAAQVTMINVEAQSPNSAPSDKASTNAVENAQIAAASATLNGIISEPTVENRPRRSFVGADKDRAEMLAAVKRGILKRSGSSSPIIKPAEPTYTLPNVPLVSPISPISPSELRKGSPKHRRDNSVTLEGEDYFLSSPRFSGVGAAASAPSSPTGSKGNVSFSPRITFHDTWPSGEYDRRGDVATCNRLTPALAQQIKEELNTFKMEMDVHEESKIYTHFF
ncbi:hypothetical protein DFH27DRAFT_609439 [Peziza echinospora]|nr:hypothetical protein DFH27DRAFT_609439 [Peziza echinospora]